MNVPEITPQAPSLPRPPTLPVGPSSAFAARLAELQATVGTPLGPPAAAAEVASAPGTVAGRHVAAMAAPASAAITLGQMLRAGALGAGIAPPVTSGPTVLRPAGAPGLATGPFAGHGGTVAPVAGPVSSDFGPRVHPITGEHRDHDGIDYAAPTGTPVRSVTDGTVVAVGDRGGYGLLVEVDHGNGTTTRYAHLSAADVRVGDRLEVGQVLGAVGSTGNSTGPHLHVEVRVDGEPVDPHGLW